MVLANFEANLVLERLRKLQMARESSRSLGHELSPLYLALESATGYIDLAVTMDQLQTALDETHQAFADLLEQEEENPERDDTLLDLVEATLDCLESFNAGSEEQVRKLAEQLQNLDHQLQQFNLASIHQRLQLQREERELLKEVQAEIGEEELEAGYLQQIIARLDAVLHRNQDPEETLDYLQDLLSKTQERSLAYDRLPLSSQEWTLEVALADRFMVQGFRHWLEALQGLLDCCASQPVDEPGILDWLEALRQGNRSWILVEQISGLDKAGAGGK